MTYRSDLERKVADDLKSRGVAFRYEPRDRKLKYVSEYNPDFELPNGVLVETKGFHRDLGTALTKLLKVRRDNPDVVIRILWDNGKMKVPRKVNGKSMTAAQWSEKNGFEWAEGRIPDQWLEDL